MRRQKKLLSAAVIAVALLAVPATVSSASASASARPSRVEHSHSAVEAAGGPYRHDLPADGPRALYERQPRLPDPRGWPAGNSAFPATSGTGRLADGGLFWTDFLYDDHGATTASTGGISVTAGSPSFGTYTYPAGPAAGNGADIFRAAVALDRHATVWRVDWTTLADPRVPVAEWTFDRDGNPATGGSAWPGGAGVTSPGIDTALLMSSRGAELIDVASGRVLHRAHVLVSSRAQSFVARLPDRWLQPRGRWRIRLASGLADPSGTGFARPPDAGPNQPAVYNVTFRKRTQEPIADNFWDDMAQTRALDSGDVSAFSATLDWSQLAHRVRTPAAAPTGWSDRWYVSSVDLGPGIITSPASIEDNKPNYLGRVQPYAVYVPRGYTGRRPAPLTFLLHSLTQDHNQYAATTPHFTQQACQARHSVCVTTLGRGPDGFYYGTAQLDFWQVWHQVAAAFRVDPDRTVLCGYSMGGLGTNELAMAHPDLFARAVTLAGAVGDVPTLANLRWVPVYLAGGGADELVPVTVERAEANALQQLGFRFRWLLIPGIDHVAYELADSFADAAAYMGNARRAQHPGRFSFRWYPGGLPPAQGNRLTSGGIAWTESRRLGVGTTGDYWLRGLKARHRSTPASVVAYSGERPEPAVVPRLTQGVDPTMQPEPAVVTTQRWDLRRRSARHAVIRLRLSNVRSLRVQLGPAGFAGRRGRLVVVSDGPVTVRLGGRAYRLAAGRHTVRVG